MEQEVSDQMEGARGLGSDGRMWLGRIKVASPSLAQDHTLTLLQEIDESIGIGGIAFFILEVSIVKVVLLGIVQDCAVWDFDLRKEVREGELRSKIKLRPCLEPLNTVQLVLDFLQSFAGV